MSFQRDILAEVEEARLMVRAWKQAKIERQIEKAATTIRRMRQSRMWRIVEFKLAVKHLEVEIDNAPPQRHGSHVQYLKSLGYSKIEGDMITKYARSLNLLVDDEE